MNDTALCPDQEGLIGYANGDLTDAEERRLDTHMAVCDRCLEEAHIVHARLHLTAAPLTVPPAAVVARAHAALAHEAPRLRADVRATESARDTAMGAIASMLLRLPVLIPAGLAVGALLVVAVQTWLVPTSQPVLLRSVQIQQITQETVVRAQPRTGAAVLAKLLPGDMVELRGEQSGWYRIVLPDGGDGWIEQRALE